MGHAITFAQQKGGAGKTTVLAHLAAAWAEAGRKVAMIDLDPQQSLTRWAELRNDPASRSIESKDYRAGGDIKAARSAATTSCWSTAPAPRRACSRTPSARATSSSRRASRR